jgi:hypothetical protein
MTAKVIAAVVGHALHLPLEGEEADEQATKIVQLVKDTAPVVIQAMMENLPVELQGQVMAAYKDSNGEIQWGYFPASEVKKGYVKT